MGVTTIPQQVEHSRMATYACPDCGTEYEEEGTDRRFISKVCDECEETKIYELV